MTRFWDDSDINWTICKQSVPRSEQITTQTPHHSIFTGRMLFLTPTQQCQSSEGKKKYKNNNNKNAVGHLQSQFRHAT